MLLELIESDTPKTFGEKVSEFIARPPQPILRFRGEPRWEGNTLHFSLRGGVPLPLFYGVYVEADGDYAEKTDHMHPFSTDNWRLTFSSKPSKVSIRVGLVPWEILTDRRVLEVR